MKKIITIEWDENGIQESHTEGVHTHELIGTLEFIKLMYWENKRLVKKDEKDN